ncbi:MAG: hypothetical protein DRQ60_08175 [Gammaproteobacteria bacterium]|nr:MAG: hypothetical protein DRQ60_08175 [Gammaproteobacteria bacterium]
MPTDNSQPAKLIKKYANRRLYDTEKSRYITLADLTVLAREQISFVVEDARSGENITRQILVQIISDHEQKEETSMMSVDALREVVSLYVPSPINQMFIDYLGNALANFMRQQSGLQRHMDGLFAEFAPPSTSTEKPANQQTDMWNSLTEIFTPRAEADESVQRKKLAKTTLTKSSPLPDEPAPSEQPLDQSELSELSELKQQMLALQNKLNQLADN